MKKINHFHVIFTFKTIKYALLLCLVPLIQALIKFDFNSFYIALQQNALILISACCVAFCFWRASSFYFNGKFLCVQQGVFLKRISTYSIKNVSAIIINRPIYCRVLGASKLTLYFEDNIKPSKLTLFLKKKDGVFVADKILPCTKKQDYFKPQGLEKLVLSLLSVNAITSVVFAIMGVKNLSDYTGQNWREIALKQFVNIETLVKTILPAGLAFLVSLLFVILTYSFVCSVLKCARFSITKYSKVLKTQSGAVSLVEQRVKTDKINAVYVKISIVSYFLQRYPLFVFAGSYRNDALPLIMYKKGQEKIITSFVGDFATMQETYSAKNKKSFMGFFAMPLICLFIAVLICIFASKTAPQFLSILILLILASLLYLIFAILGYKKEGVIKGDRGFKLCYSKLFNIYYMYIKREKTHIVYMTDLISRFLKRCNLYFGAPYKKFKVRSVSLDVADEVFGE